MCALQIFCIIIIFQYGDVADIFLNIVSLRYYRDTWCYFPEINVVNYLQMRNFTKQMSEE